MKPAKPKTHVRPAPGRLVRDPAKGYARLDSVEGYWVDLTQQYWARRLSMGDVERVPVPVSDAERKRRAAEKKERKKAFAESAKSPAPKKAAKKEG